MAAMMSPRFFGTCTSLRLVVAVSLALLFSRCTRHLELPFQSGESAYDIVEIPLGDLPDGVTVGPRHVWVTVPGDIRTFPPERGWLLKVDPSTNEVVSRIGAAKRPGKVLWAAGAVWVLNSFQAVGEQEPTLMRIDPHTDEVSHAIRVGMASWDMDADQTNVWLVGSAGDIARLDLASMALSTLRKSTPDSYLSLSGVASDGKFIWLLEGNWTRPEPANLYRFDPVREKIVSRTPVGLYATDIAFGRGAIWVVNASPREENGTVMRIDAESGLVQAAIRVGNYPFFLAVCEDAVWVTNLADRTVSRIDPEINGVTDVVTVPFVGRRVACGKGSVWVTRETRNPRKGSLLRLTPKPIGRNSDRHPMRAESGLLPSFVTRGKRAFWRPKIKWRDFGTPMVLPHPCVQLLWFTRRWVSVFFQLSSST